MIASAWVFWVAAGPLSLPYFWDEADVYVPGARWVAEHGFTLTPGAFPDEYSRGHPPLFYLLGAIAFRWLGPEPQVGHLVVMPFTVASLVLTYWLGRTVFGRVAGLAAATLLACTPLLLSVGRMFLPELPLTALGLASLLAFARGRLGWAALAGVLAIWIKETGIFVAAGVGVGVLVDAWQRGELRSRRTLLDATLASLPLLALGVFFGWQKLTAGYFVFPQHQNLFSERSFAITNLVTVAPSLFLWHGRWIVLLAALIAAIWSRHEVATALRDGQPRRGAVVAACLAPVIFYALFFAKMFWLERYALPAHPGLLIVAAGLLATAARKWFAQSNLRIAFVLAPALASAVIGLRGMWSATPPDAEEQTFAYADVIATHRSAFSALGSAPGTVLTSWPMTIELRYPYLGYVARARESSADERTDVSAVVVSSSSGRAEALREAARRRGFSRRSVHRVGLAPPVEVWRP